MYICAENYEGYRIRRGQVDSNKKLKEYTMTNKAPIIKIRKMIISTKR